MRLLTWAALAAAVAGLSGCGGASAKPPPSCASLAQPSISLAVRPERTPSRAAALCLAREYAVVIGTRAWGDLPNAMFAVPHARLTTIWQQRSLMYACNTCLDAVFRVTYLRAHHPGWIMHTATGAEVHPVGHPDEVLMNVGNERFDRAWAERMVNQLTPSGWSGVDVVDLGNDPQLTGVPVDPATGDPIGETQRRRSVEFALELIRATFSTESTPIELVGQIPPVTVVDPGEINSTYAVDGGQGFARLTGTAWEQAFDYYDAAWSKLNNSYVFDAGGPPLTPGQKVYGLASFLLVATPDSAYGAAGSPADPLYQRTLGAPCACDKPLETGNVWTRVYPNGAVAVNPYSAPATARLPSGRTISLAPESAAILDGDRLIRS
jgi:hypothetical protein